MLSSVQRTASRGTTDDTACPAFCPNAHHAAAAAPKARPWNAAFWDMDRLAGRNVTGDVEQHLITNGVEGPYHTRDFTEFVVRPNLGRRGSASWLSGTRTCSSEPGGWPEPATTTPTASPSTRPEKKPRQDDPVAACHDALFVVNRIAGVRRPVGPSVVGTSGTSD